MTANSRPQGQSMNSVSRMARWLAALALLSVLVLSVAVMAQDAVSPEASAPDWTSILPPLVAIILALVLRQVLPALFIGIWLGAWLLSERGVPDLLPSFAASFDTYMVGELADSDHAAVLVFSLLVGGLVGVITRNGGMQGIVDRIVRWADSARHAMSAATAMGFAIFFDDYANTLVVGNAMRPVTDRMRVSREKLAYLVDSTAAPLAATAFVTTWIGYEVGLLGDAIRATEGLDESAYILFLQTLPYSFYPILALAFVWMVVLSNRDFGPMLKAERRARLHGVDASEEGPSLADDGIHAKRNRPHRAINAVLPVAVLLGGVMTGLWITGEGEDLRAIIGSADSYKALIWGSAAGLVVAIVLSIGQGILSLEQCIEATIRGMRGMFYALVILILAWALGQITEDIGTATWLVDSFGGVLQGGWLPAMIFVLAAITAFGTGTAWGTMAILMPLTVPLAWAVLMVDGGVSAGEMHILYAAIASVLGGAVWGDHCSPISDTTILSSMASGCDHIEHVRTQLPYALLVGFVSILCCSLPVAFGLPWYLGLLLGAVALFAVLRFAGQPLPDVPDEHP